MALLSAAAKAARQQGKRGKSEPAGEPLAAGIVGTQSVFSRWEGKKRFAQMTAWTWLRLFLSGMLLLGRTHHHQP
jgi:hypothetical protein